MFVLYLFLLILVFGTLGWKVGQLGLSLLRQSSPQPLPPTPSASPEEDLWRANQVLLETDEPYAISLGIDPVEHRAEGLRRGLLVPATERERLHLARERLETILESQDSSGWHRGVAGLIQKRVERSIRDLERPHKDAK